MEKIKKIKDRLITPDYCFILAANFLLYFGFYLILPIMPMYLGEQFAAGSARIGMVLSLYTVAALLIRPFSGYLLDTLARKPFYIIGYFIFMVIFAGYIVASTLTLFAVMRVAHGLAFGTVSVSGNTIVIDIMPSSRRGEGLGYYGLANNISMAVGPMTGLFLHNVVSYHSIFLVAMTSCFVGLIAASFVNTPYKQPDRSKRIPVSFDRFILIKGLPAGLALILFSIPYGMTSTYVAVYGQEIGITTGTGLFFTFMAVGTATARILSGKQVDKGRINTVITTGMAVVCVAYFLYAFCGDIAAESPRAGEFVFFAVSLLLGVGFGTMFPAFNTMFVNLASNNRRGTATSTYLTSWDVGIGLGLVIGGYIAQGSGFARAYLFGAILTVVSLVYFVIVVGPHFSRNRCR